MKKLLYLMLFVVCISSCDNKKAEQERAAEQARIEQQRQDSIERAEAERIQKEQEEKARLEAERREWRGVSSLNDLKEKLEGTTWIGHFDNGAPMKFHIKNGSVHQNADSDGSDNVLFSSYKALADRTNEGDNVYLITFGEEFPDDIMKAKKGIAFLNDGTTVIWYMHDKLVGELKFVGRD